MGSRLPWNFRPARRYHLYSVRQRYLSRVVRLVASPTMGRQASRVRRVGDVLLAGVAYRAGVTGKAGMVRVRALDHCKHHRTCEHPTVGTYEADSAEECLASVLFSCSICSAISRAEPTTYNSDVASLCFARPAILLVGSRRWCVLAKHARFSCETRGTRVVGVAIYTGRIRCAGVPRIGLRKQFRTMQPNQSLQPTAPLRYVFDVDLN